MALGQTLLAPLSDSSFRLQAALGHEVGFGLHNQLLRQIHQRSIVNIGKVDDVEALGVALILMSGVFGRLLFLMQRFNRRFLVS